MKKYQLKITEDYFVDFLIKYFKERNSHSDILKKKRREIKHNT